MIFEYLKTKLEEEYHHISLWYFFSFFLGIIYCFSDINLLSINTLLSITLLLTAILFFIKKENILFHFLFYCFIMFSIGIIVSQYRISSIKTHSIEKEKIYKITGKITNIKPTTRGKQVTLEKVKITNNEKIQKIRVNFSNKMWFESDIGDVVKFKAKLFPLSSNILPGSFNFGFYLKMSGIQATGYSLTQVKSIKKSDYFFKGKIDQIRNFIYLRLIQILGKDNGNFAAAIIIGETKAISVQIADNMRNTGVAHILSVSGLHLSLVALIFFVFSRAILNLSNFLAYNTNIKLISACLSIIGSFGYLQISGGNIAATRAFIMTSIFMVATIIGRSIYPLRSVLIAAFAILLFLPEYILHPSFQLSFTAVLCLISGYNFYQEKLFVGNSYRGIFSVLFLYILTNIYTSLLASIATAPYVLFHFYKFANYSIIMNLIAVPLMSFFIMPLALLSLFLMIFNLETTLLKLVGFFIDLIIQCAEYTANLPFSVTYVGNISSISLLIFTTGFCWVSFWETRWRYWGFFIILIFVFMMMFNKKPNIIIDLKKEILGISSNNNIKLYSKNHITTFTTDYWKSWYAIHSLNQLELDVFHINKIFFINNRSFSLNYSTCTQADIMLITSKYLQCPSKNQILHLNDFTNEKFITID